MAIIHIRDLALRAIIGIEGWEREKQQDLLINISVDYDASRAVMSDNIADALDYKALKQQIIRLVETSQFNLVEKLANEILLLALADSKVNAASVTIDKPHALRFARSVAVMVSATRT